MIYLVPIDFSTATEPVLSYIETLADKKHDQITLLHCVEPNPAFVGFEAGPDVVRGQVADEFKRDHREIQALSKELRDKGYDCRGLMVQGQTVKTIIEVSKRIGAGMIVMGSHGHSAAYQILVGSVSEGVLHKTSVPVLFVPQGKRDSKAKEILDYSLFVAFANDGTLDAFELDMIKKLALKDGVVDKDERKALKQVFSRITENMVTPDTWAEIKRFRKEFDI